MRFKLILILIFISNLLQAQHQGDTWFFGDSAGISFASGSPVPDTNGILSSQEASASISDNNGNLLFYIAADQWGLNDSLTIRNRYNQTMPNGTGLKGYSSCTQGALIIPFPSDTNKYYVFCISTYFGGVPFLYYSIVDMNLDSGRGDVFQKNVLISTIHQTEKLNAVKHANVITI